MRLLWYNVGGLHGVRASFIYRALEPYMRIYPHKRE